MCDVTKSLDGFAKTHRRNPDIAVGLTPGNRLKQSVKYLLLTLSQRCLTCVAEVGNSRPLERAAADAERDHSDDSDTDSNPYVSHSVEDKSAAVYRT